MTWTHGGPELDTAAFGSGLAHLLDSALERVAERRSSTVTEADLLAALLTLRWDDPVVVALSTDARAELQAGAALLAHHVAAGVRANDVLDACDIVAPRGGADINPFDRATWRPPVAAVVDSLPAGAGLPQFLAALVEAAPSLPDGDLLTGLFDAPAILRALAAAASQRTVFGEPPEPDADAPIDSAAFAPRADFLLDQGLQLAARSGAAQCGPADLLAALVAHKDTYTHLILRRAGVSTTNATVTSHLATLASTVVGAPPLPRVQASLSPDLAGLLEDCLAAALAAGLEAIGERQLLNALLGSPDPAVTYLWDTVLSAPRGLIEELLRETAEPAVIEPYLPVEVGEVRNASAGRSAWIPRDDLVATIAKVFFRKKLRTVLLYGERGTGRSAVADVLATALREGRFAQLRHTHVIVVDLSGLDGEDYLRAAERLLSYMDTEPDRIYVVEGFGPYFADHLAACARRFAHTAYGLVLIVDTAEHTTLLGGGQVLNTFLDEVEVPEPSAAVTTAILDLASTRLAAEYGVTFAPGVSGQAMRMAGDYMLAQRFPAKAVGLLESAAADVAAEAEMTGSGRRDVARAALARRVATITGLPVETILGTGADKDYVDLLSQNLVGQEVAVAKVAGRLDLIQKGMVDKHAPAAVFVFAGLSGTGKTELAKQIAQIYSATHALITFAMADLQEKQSISVLLGSAPGLVGYEEGGALVNALNRDPYAVVLLDEVEKAHPAIWDPFLNLFDEGTVTDSRGVTASGAKAFFVMTSNIGQYEIANLLARGAPPEEIEDQVMKLFPKHVHDTVRLPCFRPEFMGRVMRRGGIVAFNALSYEALRGIAGHNFAKIARNYAEVHEGRFICDDDVLDRLARTIFEENDAVIKSRQAGYLGARRLSQLMDQFINNKLAARLRQVAGAPLVRVVLNGSDTEIVPVFADADAEALLAQRREALVSRVERRFSGLVTAPDDAFARLGDDQLARLERLFSEVGAIL
jgi:ATP-dependent Clp protease ATP-binding subunit ClpA